ncbi:MAG: hypothetical protein Tp178MES00d2C33159091_53 [Prokaryotic dsDNA virus sp.]|uniref:hypothetical protein n=1 Tax=Thalassospira sp. TaxID=1912094 RepID=UPI001187F076|nr:hypothetical protein [Thalassospira sp.]QDP61002.1 MAG: hypothetical protein Tp178MES00d2C33159091_53 [Prokaryotic dsDNA virus sp.]QDP64493.1 MAG: hypothetical protein Tp178SUR1139111_13 [Prokaryotic dsDNA virus sp.]|tara:strand:+ start:344 stop:517 length:174 start_codon:yes stop_codon:yes gene_type:complete
MLEYWFDEHNGQWVVAHKQTGAFVSAHNYEWQVKAQYGQDIYHNVFCCDHFEFVEAA